jgi:KaiC/GvpD/RAD55 family RecA-like ATPase
MGFNPLFSVFYFKRMIPIYLNKNQLIIAGRMERVKTGIPGLDKIMHGGIPEGHTVLLSGTAGTGKTILASQFVYMGAKKYKEPCVYLSFEETPDSIKRNAINFGWDFGPLEKDEVFSFLKYDPYHVDEIVNHLEGKIREISAKRVVVDSISALSFYLREDTNFRRMLFHLSSMLEKLNCTAVLVSEIVPGSLGLSRHGLAEFVSDSAVVLYYNWVDTAFVRAIQVWKMRGSSHSERLHPYKITESGITVYAEEEAFIGRKRHTHDVPGNSF